MKQLDLHNICDFHALKSFAAAQKEADRISKQEGVEVLPYDYTVAAYDSSTARAYGSSTVIACDSSTVRAYDSSTVNAYDSSTVTAVAINWNAYQDKLMKIDHVYQADIATARKAYSEVCLKIMKKREEDRQLAFAVFSQKPDSP